MLATVCICTLADGKNTRGCRRILHLPDIIVRRIGDRHEPLDKGVRSGEINSVVGDVQGKLQALEEKFGKDARLVDHLDGITVDYGDWWFNVRPSNTEPLLRLNVEANSKELMEQKRDELLAFIRG